MQEYLHVPYGCTVHGQEEIDAVVEVLRTSTQMGPNVRAFEQAIAGTFAKKHGVMVNSGTSALFLAIESMNLPRRSEVITPALTFATTVSCLVRNGLVPSFVDVAPGTYCIDVEKIESMITDNTSAMCIPNLIGNVCDWPAIREIADRHNLVILEDSADTLGATINGQSTGLFSDISITSFYGSHVINGAGNGGMLCMNDDGQFKQARLLRSWGRSSSVFGVDESESIENRFNVAVDDIPYDAKFVFEEIGYQLEPSEISAAFARVQFGKLEHNIALREKHFEQQYAFFEKYGELFELPRQLPGSRTGWLAFPVRIRERAPFQRRELQVFLEQRNIQTRVVFTGNILRQPGFATIDCKTDSGGYPVADAVMQGGMLLACHHGLTPEMIGHVHDSLSVFLNRTH
jgi:CDP-6-deoxy-D-xylo-4-hexulose-3-dehydrase